MIQKQLTPVFIAMPSLKCCVTSLRHNVSNWDWGLVVHVLDAALNVLPIGFLCILGSQEKVGSCLISSGILSFCLSMNSLCPATKLSTSVLQ